MATSILFKYCLLSTFVYSTAVDILNKSQDADNKWLVTYIMYMYISAYAIKPQSYAYIGYHKTWYLHHHLSAYLRLLCYK